MGPPKMLPNKQTNKKAVTGKQLVPAILEQFGDEERFFEPGGAPGRTSKVVTEWAFLLWAPGQEILHSSILLRN